MTDCCHHQSTMSSFHESIFREAAQSPSESLSFSYSVDTDCSCPGIETWISDQRSSPEILWEDQSMKLFRFRQSNRENTMAVNTTKSAPKASLSYPPKTSMSAMSYEKFRRQHPGLSLSEGNLRTNNNSPHSSNSLTG